jgi:ribosome biogenesis GTPase
MNTTLKTLGWGPHFARQIDLDPDGDPPSHPVRIAAVHRARLDGFSADGPISLSPVVAAGLYAVGDWVIATGAAASAPLERTTEITRRAAGEESKPQLIAANVDTLGIVTSCNADFNVARLERYLAMCSASGCLPLVILTKADQCDDPADYVKQAEKLSPMLSAIAVNATDDEDAKGRHTTTNRNLRATFAGGWLIDTPGMRELRLVDAEAGVHEVFGDITELAASCKFNDCAHVTEPGCAIRAAIAAGDLDPDRIERWRKLEKENRFNTATVGENRGHLKRLQKMHDEGQARGKAKRKT